MNRLKKTLAASFAIAIGVGGYVAWPSSPDKTKSGQPDNPLQEGSTQTAPHTPSTWEKIFGEDKDKTALPKNKSADSSGRERGADDKSGGGPDGGNPSSLTPEQLERLHGAGMLMEDYKQAVIRKLQKKMEEEREEESRTYRRTNTAGQTIYSEHKNAGGKLDDRDTAPAIQQFNEQGARIYAEHYKNGALNDGSDGEPAIMKFDKSGDVTFAQRYDNGAMGKELSGEELKKLNAPRHPAPAPEF